MDNLVEQLLALNTAQITELRSRLEQKWGVTKAVPMTESKVEASSTVEVKPA